MNSNTSHKTANTKMFGFVAACLSVPVAAANDASALSKSSSIVTIGQWVAEPCLYSAPKKVRIADRIKRNEQNPIRKAALERARARLASSIAEAIGPNFISLRQARGLNQSQLAEAAGMNQSYISKIENNRLTISDRNVSRLAEALGTNNSVVRESFENLWDFLESKNV